MGKENPSSATVADEQEHDDFDRAFDEFADQRAPAHGADADDGEGDGAIETDEPEADLPEEQSSAPDADDDDGGEREDGGGAADPKPSDDIWATVPDAARAAFEAAQAELQKLRHADLSSRGRLSQLQKRLNDLEREKPASQTADLSAVLKGEAFKRAKDDYPEILAPIEQALSGLEPRLQAMDEARTALVEQAQHARAEANEQALGQVHSDYRDYLADGKHNRAFVEWVMRQPESVKQSVLHNASSINDPADVAYHLAAFKREAGIGFAGQQQPSGKQAETTGRRQAQISAARSGRNRSVSSPSGPPDDFDAAFDHYARKMDRRRS